MTPNSSADSGPQRKDPTYDQPLLYEGEERVTLLDLVNNGLRHPVLLVALPLATAVVVVALTLLLGIGHRAQSRFAPELGDGGTMSSLPGLAAQFGINVGGLASGESLDFYAELVRSRSLLRDVVTTEFATEDGPQTLIQVYDLDDEPQDERIRGALNKLRENVSVGTDVSAGIVTLETIAPTRPLAIEINRRILELVNEFNLEKRQLRARAEREFVESQLAQTKNVLEEAEAELRSFIESNRSYESSVALQFEAARLERRVSLQQQLYTSLAQAAQQARIEEVRNTPVISLIDQPELSVRPTAKVVRRGAAGLLLGLLLAIGVLFILAYRRKLVSADPRGYAEFRRLWRRVNPAQRSREPEEPRVPATPGAPRGS